MSSFRSFGQLDDQQASDGDVGFVGMNLRLLPNQLRAGEVRLSRNGRIDGYWQPRKGVALRSGALATGVSPLQVPFVSIDAVGGFTGDDYVTVSGTLVLGGDGIYTKSTVVGGRVSFFRNFFRIAWNPSLVRWELLSGSISPTVVYRTTNGDVASPELGVWVAESGSGTPTFSIATSTVTASRVGSVVTVSAIGHSFKREVTVDTIFSTFYAFLKLSGFSGSVNPNGVRLLEVLPGNDLLTFVIPGATGDETYTGTGTLVAELDDTAVGDIRGSCHFTDPGNELQESILLASSLEVKRVALGSYAVTSLPFPSNLFLDGSVEMLQAFDRVFLFRAGQAALEWVPAGRVMSSATLASNVVTVTVKAHGLTTGDQVTLSGVTFTGGTTDPNGLRTVTVTTVDQFTFALTSTASTYGVGSAKMVARGFTFVERGAFTQPQTFVVSSSAVSVTDNLLTMTVVGNTTIAENDFVTIYRTTIGELESAVGNTFQVVSATSTEIEFFVPATNFVAGGSDTLEVGGRFSVGGGFIHMPAPPWATYFQRRLWSPFWYAPGGAFGSYTFEDLGQRDQIVASDILDANTYDQLFSQFRISGGTADYVVALQPFYEDRLMVLNRNSIHLVSGTQGSLNDTVVTELTREIGCVARKSVVQHANAVFFLSDSGVYGVEFIEQYNLRGVEEPLSKNIQPIIDRVSKALASKATGVYFNNRYWLALPLDSAVGRDDALGNNFVIVYNLLNKAWESIDNYGSGNFNIINFHIAQDSKRNSLFMVNEFGGLHEVDAREEPIDSYSINTLGEAASEGVDYELVSRGFSMNSSERKKFSRVQVQLESDDSPCDVTFSFSTEDPDSDSFVVGSVRGALGQDLAAFETATMRYRLGNPRGIYGTLAITSNKEGSAPIGRVKVNNIVVDASITNRQTISQV